MSFYLNGKLVGHCKEIEECVLPIKEHEVNEKIKLISEPFEATIEVSNASISRILTKIMVDRLAWQMAQRKMCSIY